MLFSKATVEDWCSKLKSGAYTGLVDSDELVSSITMYLSKSIMKKNNINKPSSVLKTLTNLKF